MKMVAGRRKKCGAGRTLENTLGRLPHNPDKFDPFTVAGYAKVRTKRAEWLKQLCQLFGQNLAGRLEAGP